MIVRKGLSVKLGNNEWHGCNLLVAQYGNGRLALTLEVPFNDLEEGETYFEPLAVCTVNLPDAALPRDEIFVKDYSENEGMSDWMIAQDIIMPEPEGFTESGYVTIPRYKLTLGFYREVFELALGGSNEQQQRNAGSAG
jgi:hypothetical protein